MTKPNHVMMNFWTPTWSPWGDGRTDLNLPWYVYYDYVEVYTYNVKTKKFLLDFRDDFTATQVDATRW